MVKRLTIAAVLLVAACVPASTASATTWSGSCHLTGNLDFENPVHLTVENNGFESDVSGTCTGKLNGVPYDGPATVYTDGRMNMPLSCLFGVGKGMFSQVQFGGQPGDVDAVLLDNYVTLSLNLLNTNHFVWNGAYTGHGTGEATFPSGAEAFEQCYGPGLTSAQIDVNTRTLTPMYG